MCEGLGRRDAKGVCGSKEFLHSWISKHKGRLGEQRGLRGDHRPHPEGPQNDCPKSRDCTVLCSQVVLHVGIGEEGPAI